MDRSRSHAHLVAAELLSRAAADGRCRSILSLASALWLAGQRLDVLESDDLSEVIKDMRHDVIDDMVTVHMPPKSYAEQWDVEGLNADVRESFGLDLPIMAWAEENGVDDETIAERLNDEVDKMMAEKSVAFGRQSMRQLEKQVLLQIIDTKWRDHLVTLEHLRAVVGFRGYAQRDPLSEYKSEAFQLFEGLLNSLRIDVSQHLAKVRPLTEEEQAAMMQKIMDQKQKTQSASEKKIGAFKDTKFDENDRSTWGNPGRNALCPCGSGKKFKHCHGRVQ